MVNGTDDHGHSPAGTGIVDVTVTTPGGTSATVARRSVHLHRRAGGHGPEPDQRAGGRRHFGDDHRHRLHRRHGGRLRHDGGDGPHGGQRHRRSRPQPGGHRHGGRDRDHPGRHVGHLGRRSVHLHRPLPVVTSLSPTSGPRPAALGDDHRHQLHRRHGGRLRHDGGDGFTVVSDTDDHGRPARRAPAWWT